MSSLRGEFKRTSTLKLWHNKENRRKIYDGDNKRSPKMAWLEFMLLQVLPSEVVAITLLYSEAKCIYCHQFMLALGWVTGCVFLPKCFFFTTIRHCLFWESLWEYVWELLFVLFLCLVINGGSSRRSKNQPTRVRFYDWNTSNFSYWEKSRRNQGQDALNWAIKAGDDAVMAAWATFRRCITFWMMINCLCLPALLGRKCIVHSYIVLPINKR